MRFESRQTGWIRQMAATTNQPKRLTSVAPPVPAGGMICARSKEWPALLALKDESTWNCSFAWPLSKLATRKGIVEEAYLVPDDLCRGERSHIASVGIDVASVEQFRIGESVFAACIDVRTNIVKFTKVSGELNMTLVTQLGVATDDDSILLTEVRNRLLNARGIIDLVGDLSYLRIQFWRNWLTPVHALQLACKRWVQRNNFETKIGRLIRCRNLSLDG